MIRLAKDEALAELEAWHRAQDEKVACTMCRLTDPSAGAHHIAESAHGVVVLDGFAATEGHLLVVAREHAERASELSWPVYSELQRLVWLATRALEAELAPARVYVAALGAATALPMSFPHYHVHVIPVYATDERARPARVLSWSEGVVRYGPGEAEALVARLRKAWPGAEYH